MTTGELWIMHPLFPWIMIVLGWWIICSTAIMARSWMHIKKLEQHNQLLQTQISIHETREESCSTEAAIAVEEASVGSF